MVKHQPLLNWFTVNSAQNETPVYSLQIHFQVPLQCRDKLRKGLLGFLSSYPVKGACAVCVWHQGVCPFTAFLIEHRPEEGEQEDLDLSQTFRRNFVRH